jgi:hypothetical protein
MNTGTLIARLNFAQALATNGLNAATIDAPHAVTVLERFLPAPAAGAPAMRTALFIGSPEFQRR